MLRLIRKTLIVTLILSISLLNNIGIVQAEITESFFNNNAIFNNIISDRDFTDYNSMSPEEIQAFLINKNSFLKDFSEDGRSAAQIIHDAAHGKKFTQAVNGKYDTWLGESAFGVTLNESTGTVSPKILLIFLKKEQGALFKPDRSDGALIKAMGYECPEGGNFTDNNGNGCKDQYEGFTYQVEWAAWQLRYNFERAYGRSTYKHDYQVGQTMTFTDSGSYFCSEFCGTRNITFANGGTASMYRYTPHVFYDKYNIWYYFNTWFTATPDIVVNDVAGFSIKTYIDAQTISGSKSSDTVAYLNDSPIANAGVGSTKWQIILSDIPVGTNKYTVTYKKDNAVIATKNIEVIVQKPGDINGDQVVNIQDLSIFAGYWGQENPEEPLANLNPESDYKIDISDLSIIAGYWEG